MSLVKYGFAFESDCGTGNNLGNIVSICLFNAGRFLDCWDVFMFFWKYHYLCLKKDLLNVLMYLIYFTYQIYYVITLVWDVLRRNLVMWIGQLLPLHHLCVYGRSWRTLFGIYNGTPFFRKARAVSGCPYVEAMCINVFPSLVRADRDGRYLSSSMSTICVWPLSAAICTALRSCCKTKYRILIIHTLLQNRTEQRLG